MQNGTASNLRQEPDRLQKLAERCAGAGFLLLGGFSPETGDGVPDCQSGQAAQSLLLIGNAGSALWSSFENSAEFADGRADPLDRYTRRTLSFIADEFALSVLFVFHGPPYYPFQQWALKAGGFSQSPLGVLAHASFGPWAAFRAAFLSAEKIAFPNLNPSSGPCPACTDKPCLSACPVEAISLAGGYDVPRCRDHLSTPAGAECWTGCLARHACPFGREYRHQPEQARFHMRSFLKLLER